MCILLISRSERARLNSASSVNYYFVALLGTDVTYISFFETVYVHCFIPYIIRHMIFYFI